MTFAHKIRNTGVALMCGIVALLTSCNDATSSSKGRKADDLQIVRTEQVLFNTDANDLQRQLTALKQEHPGIPLKIYPDNGEYMQLVSGFVSDPVVREIYDSVENMYSDVGWLEHDLTTALAKVHDVMPDMQYNEVYSCIMAEFDYDNRVVADGKALRIAFDIYTLKKFEKFGYFGLPMFIVDMCDPKYIVSDCMLCIAKQHIAIPSQQMTMLDYMICEGKALYLLDLVLPNTPDATKIRYNDMQMSWVKKNEQDIWGYFVNNKLLYETDFMKFHNFVDEAPKTNAFKDSAPRTTQYIGWQIVRRYMKKNHITVKELFEETDSQKILRDSGYKPDKKF